MASDRNRRDVGHIKWGHVILIIFINHFQFQKSEKIGCTILVDSNGKDLVPVSLWEAQDESILDLAKAMNEKVGRAKNN